MSLLGSVVDYFKVGSSSDLTALRAVLAADNMFADRIPAQTQRPFCVLGESGTRRAREAKNGGHRSRIEDVSVSFVVYGTSRAEVEAILEALDDAYDSTDAQLTITGRTHLATVFADRTSFYDAEGWQGSLTLDFRISKSGD